MIVPVPATADTWINSNAASTNYATEVDAYLGWQNGGAAAGIKRALMSFAIPEFTTGDPTVMALCLRILSATASPGTLFFGILDTGGTIVIAQATFNVFSSGNAWPGGNSLLSVGAATSALLGPAPAEVGTNKLFDLSELLPLITPGATLFLHGYNELESGATNQFSFETIEAVGANPPKLMFTVPDEAAGSAQKAQSPYRTRRRGT